MSFWKWFFSGRKNEGWRRFLDAWLCLHVGAALIFAWLVPGSLAEIAKAVLLPFVGILIGLSFAWASNAQSILQTTEIEELTEYSAGGFENYVFTYQAAVLIILTTVIAWGFAALGVFDLPCFWRCSDNAFFVAKVTLFFLSSLTIRECWHVVLGSQMLLLVRWKMRTARQND